MLLKGQSCPCCEKHVHDKRLHPGQCPVLFQILFYDAAHSLTRCGPSGDSCRPLRGLPFPRQRRLQYRHRRHRHLTWEVTPPQPFPVSHARSHGLFLFATCNPDMAIRRLSTGCFGVPDGSLSRPELLPHFSPVGNQGPRNWIYSGSRRSSSSAPDSSRAGHGESSGPARCLVRYSGTYCTEWPTEFSNSRGRGSQASLYAFRAVPTDQHTAVDFCRSGGIASGLGSVLHISHRRWTTQWTLPLHLEENFG